MDTYNAEITITKSNGSWYTSVFHGIPLDVDPIEHAEVVLAEEKISYVNLAVYNNNVDEGEER